MTASFKGQSLDGLQTQLIVRENTDDHVTLSLRNETIVLDNDAIAELVAELSIDAHAKAEDEAEDETEKKTNVKPATKPVAKK